MVGNPAKAVLNPGGCKVGVAVVKMLEVGGTMGVSGTGTWKPTDRSDTGAGA